MRTVAEDTSVTEEYIRTRAQIGVYVYQLLMQEREQLVMVRVQVVGEHTAPFNVGLRKKDVYVAPHDKERGEAWRSLGFTETMKTPDSTLIFATPEKAEEIRGDQTACMGCLSACAFSNWSEGEDGTTGRKQTKHP